MSRPRWWSLARWIQRVCAGIAAAGALWLVALAGLGYLQLGEAVPTPDFKGVPVPTALLLGGVALALLLSLLARLANGVGARRRARRARRALHDRIATVADDLVITPLDDELAVHAAVLKALDRERKRGVARVPALAGR